MTVRVALTRRGAVVLAVALAAFAAGRLDGSRALNAVVAPAVCALAVTAVLAWRAGRPRVVRDPPAPGHEGERGRVGLTVEGGSGIVTVRDALGDGLAGDGAVRTVADGRRERYEVAFERRGRHALGPATVAVTDPFGLWRRHVTAASRDEVTVYPRVVPVARTAWLGARGALASDARDEFASVREYRPGDPLRDVNWPASARRPDGYAVTTYEGEAAADALTVAVDVTPGGDPDAAAVAAASVACASLDAGVAVGLVTAAAAVAAERGERQRGRLLTALADLDDRPLDGPPPTGAVVVRAGGDGVTVERAGERHRFESLLGGERP